MNNHLGSNRRAFLQQISAVGVWGAVSRETALAGNEAFPRYAYIGSLSDRIEVFRVEGARWTHLQGVSCRAPVSLALHPNQQFLYAANNVALHEGLPRGTVEVFSIDRRSGALAQVQLRPLSLSGTEPRSLAITPNGRNLVVAIYGGGAYNVLSIEQDGTLGAPKAIFKSLGSGVHGEHQGSAHPHTVLCDKQGRFVLSSDLGCDELSVFALTDEGGFERRNKVPVARGAGPGSIVLHPGGSWLYVKHELTPAIACHRYRQSEGIIEGAFQTVALPLGRGNLTHSNLTMDAKGRFLYVSSAKGMAVGVIDPLSGALSIRYEGRNAESQSAIQLCL